MFFATKVLTNQVPGLARTVKGSSAETRQVTISRHPHNVESSCWIKRKSEKQKGLEARSTKPEEHKEAHKSLKKVVASPFHLCACRWMRQHEIPQATKSDWEKKAWQLELVEAAPKASNSLKSEDCC